MERYTTNEMKDLMSNKYRATFFRRLWVIIAEIEQTLGLTNITDTVLNEMKANVEVTDDDMIKIDEHEQVTKHDVMAHIRAYGERLSSESKKYIHLGCTSCFVQDNADMLIYIDALEIIINKLIKLIQLIAKLSEKEKATVCVGYTHLQVAQFVTVGKRFALWNQDLAKHVDRLKRLILHDLELLGAKGATGTQDSYLKLLDEEKVLQIDDLFAKKVNKKVITLSGQTYTRAMDNMILDHLGEIASSFAKIAENIRIWQSGKEVCEPFEKGQVGSSAMPYKHNPMRCERINSLSRIVIANKNVDNDSHQWFERTLDDSANRRLVMKQSLTLTDYMITLMCNIISGITIHHEQIQKNALEVLPYIITESVLMKVVKGGKDRDEAHDKIKHIADSVKLHEVIGKIKADEYFKDGWDIIDNEMKPELYVGICSKQVDIFHSRIMNLITHQCKEFDITFRV